MFKKIVLFVFCLVLCHSTIAGAAVSDMVRLGADARIEEGTTASDVVVIFGDLTVNGTVANDAVVLFGDLKVGPTGRVLENSVVVFGKLIRSPGAEINESVIEVPLCGKGCMRNYLFPVMGIFALGAFGLVILAGFAIVFLLIAILFTDRVGRASFYIERAPWRSLFYGFATTVLILPIILLLIVSIIGIPVVPLFIIAILAASLFGYTTMCQLVGLKFFRVIKRPGQHMLWEVAVGFLIIGAVVLLPFIGWFIKLLAWMTGLGATVATKFGKERRV